jgi:hypothetical protein
VSTAELQAVIDAAIAWRAAIPADSPVNAWAGGEDLALIAAVDNLSDSTVQRELAPLAVAPTEPAPALAPPAPADVMCPGDPHADGQHLPECWTAPAPTKGLDLAAADEAALAAIHQVDCLDGDDCLATPMMSGRYGRMAEAAIRAAAPHVLRAIPRLCDDCRLNVNALAEENRRG